VPHCFVIWNQISFLGVRSNGTCACTYISFASCHFRHYGKDHSRAVKGNMGGSYRLTRKIHLDHASGLLDFFFTENDQSYTSRRAAGLYAGAAPDSVHHLSDQFYFGRDGKMFANVGTVVAVDSLEQANPLAKDVNSILHRKLEKGEEIRAVRVGSGPAIRCSASNLISAQMRIQRFWMVPEVLDLAYQHGHQEPPFMAALIYL
jgi:hypothetical protein